MHWRYQKWDDFLVSAEGGFNGLLKLFNFLLKGRPYVPFYVNIFIPQPF